MTDELPQGWTTAKLDEVLSLALGGDWGKDPDELADGMAKVLVIRGTEFKTWRKDKGASAAERCIKVSSLEKRRLQKGDLVLEVSGGGPQQPVGRTVLIDDEALKRANTPLVCSNFFRLLRLHAEMDARFISHFLDYAYVRGAFNEFQTETTNLRNLNVTDFLQKTEIAIAPLAEQQRIVVKLELLLGQVDACRQRLEKIPTLLKRFRRAVLAAACSGRLTEDWRDGDDGTDELPRSWSLVEFGSLIADGPQNGLYKPQSCYGSGTPIVRIDAFYDGKITNWAELKRLQIIKKEREQFALADGDILINRVNSPKFLGKSALVQAMPEVSVYESNMMCLRLDTARARPDYAVLYLRSAQGLEELRKNAKHAVNQSSINQEDVKSALFALPPLPEQQEIVRRVEALFALADNIEQRYRKAQVFIDKLTPSLLAKAFRGKLVPQDPNDEPASVLLERIKAEREKNKPQSRKKR